jgi:uncharacterized protein (DUF1330 family)
VDERRKTIVQHLTTANIADFVAEDPHGAVVMLNLIRFHPDGGRERYQQYLEAAQALPDSEVEWIYYGTLHHSLESTNQPDWDAVVLARYASRAAFFDASQSAAYQQIRHLRDTAITDSLLQPSTSLMH